MEIINNKESEKVLKIRLFLKVKEFFLIFFNFKFIQ